SALQPEVLPALGAALRRVREAARPAARWARSSCGRGLPPVRQARSRLSFALAGGLVLALASAVALNWSYYVQHGAAASLPPLSVRRPLRSLGALVGNRRWLIGFWTGVGGWVPDVRARAPAARSRCAAWPARG